MFREASLSATLKGLDALPDGSFYQAWLIGPEAQPQNLGKLVVFNGDASIDFKSADGQGLLPRFTGFEISVEQGDQEALKPGQVVYSGEIDPAALKGLTAVVKATPNQPLKTAVLGGVKSQSAVFNSHLKFTIDAIAAGDLAKTKQHSEHVINIIVGKDDTRFGDYNGDNTPQNPGNGVGLEVYLKLLRQAITATAAAPDADQAIHAAANDLTRTIDQALATLEAAESDEQALTVADSAAETADSAKQLSGYQFGDKLSALADQAGALNLGFAVEVRSVSP